MTLITLETKIIFIDPTLTTNLNTLQLQSIVQSSFRNFEKK